MWKFVAKAMNAEQLSESELQAFKEISGDRNPHRSPLRNSAAIVGRGGGKNAASSALMVITAAAPLKALVSHMGNSSITLRNGVVIETYANDYKSVRGRSLYAFAWMSAVFILGRIRHRQMKSYMQR
jgi:hypothetical protein